MPDSTEFKITVTDIAVKEILIALLSAAGATGFEEEKDTLKAFVIAGDNEEILVEKIIEENNITYSKSVIKEKNWNAIWEADFKPVTIGNFAKIRAGFHEPDANVQHDIIITPKMSFGTGHHATTHMMIAAMAKLDLTEKKFFDYGTGTGVLAILAEKRGAATITAIDNDDWSIVNAMENFILNKCHKILLTNSGYIDSDTHYDVILANINRNIILANLAQIKQHLANNGVVLLSGLLTGDEEVILAESQKNGLMLKEKSEMDGWICLLMVIE